MSICTTDIDSIITEEQTISVESGKVLKSGEPLIIEIYDGRIIAKRSRPRPVYQLLEFWIYLLVLLFAVVCCSTMTTFLVIRGMEKQEFQIDKRLEHKLSSMVQIH